MIQYSYFICDPNTVVGFMHSNDYALPLMIILSSQKILIIKVITIGQSSKPQKMRDDCGHRKLVE